MTHELKTIIEEYLLAKSKGLKSVLATVVHLEGSSYRKPGVRMLITQKGKLTGAVSGGCVEKEVLRQAQTVFVDDTPKMMTYDGRYRLGCEGILYILLEPLNFSDEFLTAFRRNLKARNTFKIDSLFTPTEGSHKHLGSTIYYQDDTHYSFYNTQNQIEQETDLDIFSQTLKPAFKLILIGAEHDAVALCQSAAFLGWEVTVVAPPKDAKQKSNFPGVHEVVNSSPEMFEYTNIDDQTAIVLMTHNYALDLNFLVHLAKTRPAYVGLLGPKKRREKLLHEFLEYYPEVEPEFLEILHGPAGLNIGSITAQEIAISILSEILSVIRAQNPMLLKEKVGAIHS